MGYIGRKKGRKNGHTVNKRNKIKEEMCNLEGYGPTCQKIMKIKKQQCLERDTTAALWSSNIRKDSAINGASV